MADKKGNTGRGGGQYNNTNALKWTKKKADELGEELLAWIKPNVVNVSGKLVDANLKNVFFNEFLILNKGLYPSLIPRLCKNYPSFAKVIERAKAIQEIKLWKLGCHGAFKEGLTKFALVCLHDHKEKQQIDAKVEQTEAYDYSSLSNEELLNLKELLTKAKKNDGNT